MVLLNATPPLGAVMKNLLKAHRTLVLYLIFGGLTTAVNMVCFFLFKKVFSTGVSNILAWFFSVLFAFVTNKHIVFHDKSKNRIKQLAEFFGARIFSGALDTVIIVIFIDYLLFPEFLIKLLSNILVIIINYVASRYIFKR